MIAEDFTPYLIEVNHSPSFTGGSPLDKTIKKYLLLDTLNLLNLDNQDKIDYLKRPTQENGERIPMPQITNFKKLYESNLEYEN